MHPGGNVESFVIYVDKPTNDAIGSVTVVALVVTDAGLLMKA
jgi:hypothetical protein